MGRRVVVAQLLAALILTVLTRDWSCRSENAVRLVALQQMCSAHAWRRT